MTAFVPDGEVSGGEASGPYDGIAPILSAAPRPRPVRMSRRGKMRTSIIGAALLGSLGIFAAGMSARPMPGTPAGPVSLLSSALPIILVFAVAIWIIRGLGRQKLLLGEGEVALARVTKRWIGRRGENVQYEFATPTGGRFSRSAEDGTRSLHAGMIVPVFYDPQNPKKQIALCASFYEVVLPGAK